MVRQQISAIVDDFDVRALKSGMLATRELVELVAGAIHDAGLGNYVLDPVMVASSGDRLLDEDAVSAITTLLLPMSSLVTPNLDEARMLTGIEVHDEASMRAAASLLVARGARAALIKGGHLAGDDVTDVFFDGAEFQTYRRPRIATNRTHGTGCTLSAAIAAGLAHARSLEAAVVDALDFVNRAIASAPGIGHGHGPLNHLTAAATTPAH
jgi:hydroxymethylpyrimidine/phosphomethylpyrimidine kinase